MLPLVQSHGELVHFSLVVPSSQNSTRENHKQECSAWILSTKHLVIKFETALLVEESVIVSQILENLTNVSAYLFVATRFVLPRDPRVYEPLALSAAALSIPIYNGVLHFPNAEPILRIPRCIHN